MLGAEGADFTVGSIITGIFGLYGLALFAYEAWKWDTSAHLSHTVRIG